MKLTFILKKFKHQKLNSLLRIISMGLGMGGALVLFYIVMNKLTTDQFLPGKDRIYQVFAHYQTTNNNVITDYIWEPLVPAMVSDLPQVKNGTVGRYAGINTYKKDNSLFQAKTLYADSSFFKVFERPFIIGSPKQSLKQINTAVITQKFAGRLFGTKGNAIGKIIFLNQNRPIQITGVIKNWPQNSSFKVGIIISFATLKDEHRFHMGWATGSAFQGYVKLEKNVKPKQINGAIPALLHKHYDVKAQEASGFTSRFNLVPITKAFLTNDPKQKTSLIIMSIIGFLILGLACFNALLLILSGRQKFYKEIFIQRTLGASGFDVQKLIFKETLAYLIVSLAVTIGFILLINPLIETNYQISLINAFTNSTFLILALIIFLVVFVINYWVPVRWTFRYFGGKNQTSFKNNILVNKILPRFLLTLQIGISILLFIFLWVIHSQFTFINHYSQGYNPNNLVYINLQNKPLFSKDKVIKSEVAKIPNVLSACLSQEIPVYGQLSGNQFSKSPSGKNLKYFWNISVGPDFFKTLDMKIKGPGFEKSYVNKNSIVITKKVAQSFDLKSPLDKIIYENGKPYRIRAVVPDIVAGSIHSTTHPTIFSRYDQPSPYSVLTVRIASNQMGTTVRQIKNTIEKLVPGQIIQVNYYNTDIKANYEEDTAMKKTVSFFALFAAFITLAGLIGFTTTLISKRTKELGIRKINGASEQSLLILLNKTFVITLVISILVFVPIAYRIAKIWLQNFAHAVSLQAWIFMLVSVVVSVVVLAVVSIFTLKAARMNPAQTLRYE